MIITKPATKAYTDNYERIFKKDIVKESENNQKDSQNGSTTKTKTPRRNKS